MEEKMAKTCDGCKNKVYTEEEKMMTVPYIAHQSAAARQERQIRRMWIALIVSVCMLFASNMGWLLYESQFDTYSYDYTQDGNSNNIIGNGNEVDYNGAEIEDTDTQEEEQ
jgi:hypothetical protein